MPCFVWGWRAPQVTFKPGGLGRYILYRSKKPSLPGETIRIPPMPATMKAFTVAFAPISQTDLVSTAIKLERTPMLTYSTTPPVAQETHTLRHKLRQQPSAALLHFLTIIAAGGSTSGAGAVVTDPAAAGIALARGVGRVPLAQTLPYSLNLQRVGIEGIMAALLCASRILERHNLGRSWAAETTQQAGGSAATLVANDPTRAVDGTEAEATTYWHLRFLLHLATSEAARLHLASPSSLHTLLALLRTGSPRIIRVVLLIIGRILPALPPPALASAMGIEPPQAPGTSDDDDGDSFPPPHPFVTMLLEVVAASCAMVSDTGVARGAMAAAHFASPPAGFGQGRIVMAQACEAAGVLNKMLQTNVWRPLVAPRLYSSLLSLRTITLYVFKGRCAP